MFAAGSDGLGAVGGGPDDREIWLRIEQPREPVADDLVIVGDDDSDLR
jgi:hypothetical protein